MTKKKLGGFLKTFKKNRQFVVLAVFLMALSFALGMVTGREIEKKSQSVLVSSNQPNLEKLQEQVLPPKGYTFKIRWGELGKKLVADGVIEEEKLAQALTGTLTLPPQFKKYFDGTEQEKIELNQETAQFWVDVLWGLGLANKNPILEKGPMVEAGQTANFASTGGYTLGKQEAMTYYSKFSYIPLSEDEQKVVEEIANGVFRPCCGNSTAFPDCNHGMAALGLIELMVSQKSGKDEIYKTVLAFNSYWFPQTYLDIAYYFTKKGQDWRKVPANEILFQTYSSGMGYQTIKKEIGEVAWPLLEKGGSCGV